MAVYRRTSRSRYVLAVLVLAALTLVTIDARSNGTGVLSDLRNRVDDVFAPLQRATHAALQPIGNFLGGAADYGSLRKENQRLRQQLAQLETQGVASAAVAADAQEVLRLQHLPFAAGVPIRTVQIIDFSPSNFENTVTIDMGTSSGIAVGQPVVGAGGLVGSVVEAGSNQASVELLTDPDFEVGVRLQGNNVGTAQGLGGTEPMDVTVDTTGPPQAPPKIEKGQILLTSGLDLEKFPPDIPVGTVVTVSQSPTSPEPDVTIDPVVDLGQLTYLDVLLWSPS